MNEWFSGKIEGIKDALDWRERLGEWYTNLMLDITDGAKGVFAGGSDLWWQLLIIAALIGVYLNIAGFKKYGNTTIKVAILTALITSVVNLYV